MLSFRRIGHVFMVMVPNYQCHHSRTHKKSNKKSAAGKPPPPPPKNTISHQPNATTTRNGRMVVCTKTSVWASHWLVALRAFYRRIPSLAFSFFPLKLPPPACEAVLVGIYNKRMGVNPTGASFAWPGNAVGHAGPEAKVPDIFQAERGGLT